MRHMTSYCKAIPTHPEYEDLEVDHVLDADGFLYLRSGRGGLCTLITPDGIRALRDHLNGLLGEEHSSRG